jgi:hypothetical protein
MTMSTPANVNSRFSLPIGGGYVGSVREHAPRASQPDNTVKRQPKLKPIHSRQARVLPMRVVVRFPRTVFGVLPRARRVRAANDPGA